MAMNKAQLVDAVAEKASVTKAVAENVVKAAFESISSELSTGGSFTLIGFGTFSVSERSARDGKNPQTGATIKIAAKKVAKFKPGKALAESVNATKPAAKKKAPAKKK